MTRFSGGKRIVSNKNVMSKATYRKLKLLYFNFRNNKFNLIVRGGKEDGIHHPGGNTKF